jgi:hypothetical protein
MKCFIMYHQVNELDIQEMKQIFIVKISKLFFYRKINEN